MNLLEEKEKRDNLQHFIVDLSEFNPYYMKNIPILSQHSPAGILKQDLHYIWMFILEFQLNVILLKYR